MFEPAVPDREAWIEVNRTRLRMWQGGDPTAPPVFCLRGAHDHGRMFDELAPAVAELAAGQLTVRIATGG